jgi:hypothetical protein
MRRRLASFVQHRPVMKHLVLVAVCAFFASGCLVHQHRPGRRQQAVSVKNGGCHPSQVWDGKTCRHKGKGEGARKHDGR